MLVPNKMQHIICTGNVGPAQYQELCGLVPNGSVYVSAGDYDTQEFPDCRVVQVGQFKIGIMHGHQMVPYNCQDAKSRMRRKLNVDIFVSGHTHQNEVVLQDGYYHINPVSIHIHIYVCTVDGLDCVFLRMKKKKKISSM